MRVHAVSQRRKTTALRWSVMLALALCATWSAHAEAKDRTTSIAAVELFERGGGSEVVIRTDGEPDYSARVAQDGRRIVIDVRDAKMAGAAAAIAETRGVV